MQKLKSLLLLHKIFNQACISLTTNCKILSGFKFPNDFLLGLIFPKGNVNLKIWYLSVLNLLMLCQCWSFTLKKFNIKQNLTVCPEKYWCSVGQPDVLFEELELTLNTNLVELTNEWFRIEKWTSLTKKTHAAHKKLYRSGTSSWYYILNMVILERWAWIKTKSI